MPSLGKNAGSILDYSFWLLAMTSVTLKDLAERDEIPSAAFSPERPAVLAGICL
jgi:hypothetical protein